MLRRTLGYLLVLLLRNPWAYILGGVICIGIGVATYVTAHPTYPVEISGTISSYAEITQNGGYDHNELQVAGDSTTYTLDKESFTPILPDQFYTDGKVQFWVDQGSTTIVAITLYDAEDLNPTTYTTAVYDNPQSAQSGAHTAGITLAAIGAIATAFGGVWYVRRRRRIAAYAVAGPAIGAPLLASSGSEGLSPDGRWFWDGMQWRNVSDDGRMRWDGAEWRELSSAGEAIGAPPPPAS